jgi:CubicO group peptidase (beta-lactamase class C family)
MARDMALQQLRSMPSGLRMEPTTGHLPGGGPVVAGDVRCIANREAASMHSLDTIDRAMSDAVAAGDVPGIVVAAADRKDIFYESAFGMQDPALGRPMVPDSVFRLASMTKAITCAAAMQLVEQGRLHLDKPISEVLPELRGRQVFEGFAADGRPRLRPARGEITLRRLMTHTAGFAYEAWNSELARYIEFAGIPSILSRRREALNAPLVRDPGTAWEYGINIDFVGRAVEEVSGLPLSEYFEAHLFQPLAMTDIGYRLRPDQHERLVVTHQRRVDGGLDPKPGELPPETGWHGGGGGLYGTARDYLRFLRMLLNGGALEGVRVLKAETVALMGQNHIGELNVVPLPSAAPALTNAVDFFPEQDKKWGLSFLINTRRTAEGRSAGSLAWAGLANTYFWLDPTRDIAGVALMQVLPFADAKALDVLSRFERGIYETMVNKNAVA